MPDPETALALPTALLDFERAVALMPMPFLVTNAWQGGVVPALLGMVLGRRIRRRLSERRFRQVLFATLTVVGAFIVVRDLVL